MDQDDDEDLKRGDELLRRQFKSMCETYGLSAQQVADLSQGLEVNELVAMETAKSVSERLGSENRLDGVRELMNWVVERDLGVMERWVEMAGENGRMRDEIEQLKREIDQIKKRAA